MPSASAFGRGAGGATDGVAGITTASTPSVAREHADAVTVPVDEMLLGVTPGELALATGPVPLGDVECFVEILRDLTDDRRAHGREPRDGGLHGIAGRSRDRPALVTERPADAERRHLDVVDRTEGDGRAPGVAVVGSRDDRENVDEGPDARPIGPITVRPSPRSPTRGK